MGQSTCSVDGCGRGGRMTRGWCTMHYQRWQAHGDVNQVRKPVNSGPCSVDGCDGAARKRGWCESHYSQWRYAGSVGPLAHQHSPRSACRVCGSATQGSKYRQFCSASCYILDREHGGAVPRGTECPHCGDWVSFLPEDNGGVRRKSSLRACDRCERRALGVTAWELADRDGTACGICGTDVDMSLPPSDEMGPTRDHILPWSLGGSDEPDNLRLAHRLCNVRRGNRVQVAV